LKQLEKRQKAVQMLEVEQPIFAQLYLLIDKMEGGIMFDREGNAVPEVQTGS